jgi:hypothetical protein
MIEGVQAETVPKFNCDFCRGLGWAETAVFYSQFCPMNTIVIEKCDECQIFESDFQAALEADNQGFPTFQNRHGFNIRIFC